MEHQRVGSAQFSSNRAGGHAGKVHLFDPQVASAKPGVMVNDPTVPPAYFTGSDFPFHVFPPSSRNVFGAQPQAKRVSLRGQAAEVHAASNVACGYDIWKLRTW
jgi:hypothetical protein